MSDIPDLDMELFFELSLDMLCVVGTDTVFRRVNPSFERTLGYSVDEMTSKSFLEFVHPDDRDRSIQEVEKLTGGIDTVYFENRYRHKDGSWRWFAWTCPAPAQGGDLLYAVARDMTWQKSAEEELRIRDSILGSMQHGLLITDNTQPDNPIIYANQAFADLTGYTREEIVGRNCRFLQGDDAHQSQLDIVREAVTAGRPCRALLRNYRKDGSMFWNELTLAPVSDPDGTVTHFVGIQNDITEFVHRDEQDRQQLVDRMDTLTPRQREVMDLLVMGLHTKAIASQLQISVKTVEAHRAQVLEKMDVNGVVELVREVLINQR